MTLEDNKDVIRRFEAAGNEPRDLEAIWSSLDPDCTFPSLSRRFGRTFTLADYKSWLLQYFEALPDVAFTIEDMVAEDDKVWFRLNIQGTHRGTLRDVPATGNRVNYTQIGMFRVRDGKIVETESFFDDLTLLRQLGVTTI